MPVEYRFIVFRPNEAAQALSQFARRNGRKVPKGKPINAEPVTNTDPPSGNLMLEVEDSKERKISFKSEEVVAALILHCLTTKIPLPQNSEKVLEAFKLDNSMRFALRIGVFPDQGKAKKTSETGQR
ncbi:MAG: hypothetical protein NXI19_13155 [Alphaproteobacteria bacterium]|nr:hypothetical protein [Alphaproteobacteria bacterium]